MPNEDFSSTKFNSIRAKVIQDFMIYFPTAEAIGTEMNRARIEAEGLEKKKDEILKDIKVQKPERQGFLVKLAEAKSRIQLCQDALDYIDSK